MRKELQNAGRIAGAVTLAAGGAVVAEAFNPPAEVAAINAESFTPGEISRERMIDILKHKIAPKLDVKQPASSLNQEGLNFEWSKIAVCDVEPNEVEIRAHNLNNVTVEVTGSIYAQDRGGEIKEISSVPEPYRACGPDAWCGPDERIENQYSSFDGDVWGYAEVKKDGVLVAREELDRTHLHCGAEPTPTPTPTPAFQFEWSNFAVCDIEPNEVEIRAHNLNPVTVNVTGTIFAQHNGGEVKVLSSVPEPYQACAPDAWCGPDERIENQYSFFDGDVWGKAEVTYNGQVVDEEVMNKTHLHCGTEPTATPTATKTAVQPSKTPTRTPVGPSKTPTRTPFGPTATATRTSVGPTRTATATERPVMNQTPVAPATGSSEESRPDLLPGALVAAGVATAAAIGLRRKFKSA